MNRRLLGLVVAVLALVTACGGSSSHALQTPARPSAEHIKLVAAAHLRACPPSSSTPVSGGLPDLTLGCLGRGPRVHLAGLTGKPTVVNLWGSWCEPCQSEASYLSSTYDKVRGSVRFLGVDIEDSDDSALDFGTSVKPPVRYPSVVDPDKDVLNALHFQGPPATLFLDATGKIVGVHNGVYLNAAAVRADLATYLHVTA